MSAPARPIDPPTSLADPGTSLRALANEARRLIGHRAGPGDALASQSPAVAAACRAMAGRFHDGGTLFVLGTGAAAADAAHVAVEFIHPVIVGTRALPALALSNDICAVSAHSDAGSARAPAFERHLRTLAGSADLALGIAPDGADPAVRHGLSIAHDMGLLTVALTGADGTAFTSDAGVDHHVTTGSADPLIATEMLVTGYHLLWELVHVWLEHPDLLEHRGAA